MDFRRFLILFIVALAVSIGSFVLFDSVMDVSCVGGFPEGTTCGKPLLMPAVLAVALGMTVILIVLSLRRQ